MTAHTRSLPHNFFNDAAPFKIQRRYCKLIPLTQGQFTIVEMKDYRRFAHLKWFALWNPHTKSYYAKRSVRIDAKRCRSVWLHREILGLPSNISPDEEEKMRSDHKWRSTLDNRRSALRAATERQNAQNSGVQKNNTSGATGVSQHIRTGKWQAYIGHYSKLEYIGTFNTFKQAKRARDKKAREYHGQFRGDR